jgi:hypothetical protein
MTTRRAIGPMISVYHDLPGDTFRTAFFDHTFVTQIGIVSHPLKTPGATMFCDTVLLYELLLLPSSLRVAHRRFYE